ncbi:hypothetical protein GGI43DRAFT_400548 [Trichoderma evansii]
MMSVKRISINKTQRAVTRPEALSSNAAETAPNRWPVTRKFAAYALLWPPLPLRLLSRLRACTNNSVYVTGITWMLLQSTILQAVLPTLL